MNPVKYDASALLHWEGLQVPRRLTRLKDGGAMIAGGSTATVSRNDSYYVQCEVAGFSNEPFGPCVEFQNKRSGPFTFSGYSDGYEVSLRNCHLVGLDASLDSDSGSHRGNSFRLTVDTFGSEQVAPGKWKRTAHIDWFLNGARGLIFTRRAQHQHDSGYARRVEGHPECTLASVTTSPGANLDSAVIRLPSFTFVLRAVPDGFGPPWSRNVAIEYHSKPSRIPDEETREAVAEVVSFVLGRRLIGIGDTDFATGGVGYYMHNWEASKRALVPVEVKPQFAFHLRSWNPSGINVPALCSKIDFAPIPIDRVDQVGAENVEDVLAKLVPAYLERRKVLAMGDALWRYWAFQELPLGINLPMLVSGIEILASAWFSSDSSSSHGNFVPKKEFIRLCRQGLESVGVKLARAAELEPSMAHLRNPEVREALIRRMEDSFQMGPTARTRAFLRELGIKPRAAQLDALKGRHAQIHSGGSRQTPTRLWRLSENLRTLFYEIMLRLLGYSGGYLDWGQRIPAVRQLRALSQRGLE